MLHTLAVSTDFSELSRVAFGPAADLARRFEARLFLLHAIEGPEVYTPWQLPESSGEAEERRAHVERRLGFLGREDPAFHGLRVEPCALVGEPSAAVAQFVRTHAVDLLAVSSHGSTGSGLFGLGSFAARTLRLACAPVLVVRGSRGGGEWPRSAFAPRRILVPHDFSHASAQALAVARDWALEFEARARLVFVVDGAKGWNDASPQAAEGSRAHREAVRREGQERLDALLASDWRGVEADAVARLGNPAAEILREARELDSELIVLASRGLSAVERLSVGSVAERVVHGAHCPVLVVKERSAEGHLLG